MQYPISCFLSLVLLGCDSEVFESLPSENKMFEENSLMGIENNLKEVKPLKRSGWKVCLGERFYDEAPLVKIYRFWVQTESVSKIRRKV